MVIIITRWVIYDSYVAYETAKELAEEREMKKEAKDIKVRTIKIAQSSQTFVFKLECTGEGSEKAVA